MVQFLKFKVKLFEKIEKRGVPVFLSSFLILGVLPFSILIIFFRNQLYLFNHPATYLIFVWFVFSRYIVYLGYKIAETSYDSLKDIFLDQEIFKRKNDFLCKNFYSNKAILIALPFIICAIYVVNSYFSQATLGLHIWLTVVVIILFLNAGIGLWNSFGALYYFTDILKDKLDINPLHPDGFGGLEPIGSYIIKSTLIISTGSLVVPFALMAVSDTIIGGELRFVTLILTGLYILIVLLSFIVPLLKLNSIAKRYKYGIIKRENMKYNSLLNEMLNHPSIEKQARLDVYYNTYLVEIKKMKIWPFTGLTLIQVFGAIALPATTLLLQILNIL